MSRLSQIFKSSRSSVNSDSRRSSMVSDCSSPTSPVSVVQFPGLVPAQRQRPFSQSSSSPSSASSGVDYAEMLDDDNMSWGKPKKSSKSSRR